MRASFLRASNFLAVAASGLNVFLDSKHPRTTSPFFKLGGVGIDRNQDFPFKSNCEAVRSLMISDGNNEDSR